MTPKWEVRSVDHTEDGQRILTFVYALSAKNAAKQAVIGHWQCRWEEHGHREFVREFGREPTEKDVARGFAKLVCDLGEYGVQVKVRRVVESASWKHFQVVGTHAVSWEAEDR